MCAPQTREVGRPATSRESFNGMLGALGAVGSGSALEVLPPAPLTSGAADQQPAAAAAAAALGGVEEETVLEGAMSTPVLRQQVLSAPSTLRMKTNYSLSFAVPRSVL